MKSTKPLTSSVEVEMFQLTLHRFMQPRSNRLRDLELFDEDFNDLYKLIEENTTLTSEEYKEIFYDSWCKFHPTLLAGFKSGKISENEILEHLTISYDTSGIFRGITIDQDVLETLH